MREFSADEIACRTDLQELGWKATWHSIVYDERHISTRSNFWCLEIAPERDDFKLGFVFVAWPDPSSIHVEFFAEAAPHIALDELENVLALGKRLFRIYYKDWPMTTDAERISNGEKNRRKVLGDAHVDRSLKNRNDFNGEWVDFITRVAWGDVWQRPGLDYKSRSIVVLSVATSLGRWEEFRIHVKGAINNGLSKDEIKEVLMQCAVYAGVPAANTAFHEAQKVFDEMAKG